MAVLGRGGKLRLNREPPNGVTLDPSNLNTVVNTVSITEPGFWSGDRVTLVCADGLPLDDSNNGPDCPEGYAVYAGSDWYKGSNRAHIADNDSAFYSNNNSARFYMRAEECGLTTTRTFYINRDQADGISFYNDRAKALSGRAVDRARLYKVKFRDLQMTYGGVTDYDNDQLNCLQQSGDYKNSDIFDVTANLSFCAFAPTYREASGPAEDTIVTLDYELITGPNTVTANYGLITAATTATADYGVLDSTGYKNADVVNRTEVGDTGIWLVQGLLREWVLNLTSTEIDTTAVGERYGDAIKSIVTGGGSLDFLIDRRSLGEDVADPTYLYKLLLLTERGSRASAEFWMIQNRDELGELLPGDLFYETGFLVTSSAINTRADDIIAGSINFVTVGEIALRMGEN